MRLRLPIAGAKVAEGGADAGAAVAADAAVKTAKAAHLSKSKPFSTPSAQTIKLPALPPRNHSSRKSRARISKLVAMAAKTVKVAAGAGSAAAAADAVTGNAMATHRSMRPSGSRASRVIKAAVRISNNRRRARARLTIRRRAPIRRPH